MRCDSALDLLADSFMDTLEEDALEELHAHLAGCEDCAAEASRLRSVWTELGRLRESAGKEGIPMEDGYEREVHGGTQGWGALARAAAVVLLLASGAFLGRLEIWSRFGGEGADAIREGSPYLLLIRSDEPERRAPEAQLVSEYSAWAGELAQRGLLISAEKLSNDVGRWVQGETPAGDTDVISGFFLIRAADYDEAERVARASPHVAYGGTIELRRIEDVGGSR